MKKIIWNILSIVLAFPGFFCQQTCSSKCMQFRRFPEIGTLNLIGLFTFTFRSTEFRNCSVTCYYNNLCSFFSFNDQKGTCSGFSAIAKGNWEPNLTLPITGIVFHQGINDIYVNDSMSGLFMRIPGKWYRNEDARKECSRKGERMVALDTPEKLQRIAMLIHTLEMVTNRFIYYYWIGLTYNTKFNETRWYWDSGIPLGDPSPLTMALVDTQRCGSIHNRNKVRDGNCADTFRTICERY